jgi:hypothetical protein
MRETNASVVIIAAKEASRAQRRTSTSAVAVSRIGLNDVPNTQMPAVLASASRMPRAA